MLEYEMFKEIVENRFMSFMPEKYKDYQVSLGNVQKVNRTVDILEIIPKEIAVKMPSLYFPMDSLYESYLRCGNLQMVFQKTIEKAVDAIEKGSGILEKIDYGKAGEQVIMALVNTEQNKELLEHTPHREWQDLSIVYRWLIDVNKDGQGNILINDELADTIGMSEEDLHTAAVKNTLRIFPPKVENMNEEMRKIWSEDGIPEEMIEFLIGIIPKEKFMYVISNSRNFFGAVSILYENVLNELAESVGSDLYLMLSSVQEVIAVAASGDPNEIERMVREINVYGVPLEEQLSNQVYYYDKDLRKVSLATDTPYKQLESIVEKRFLIH